MTLARQDRGHCDPARSPGPGADRARAGRRAHGSPSGSGIQRTPTVSEPADRLESEAAAAAGRIVADQPVAGVTSTRGGPADRTEAPDETVLETLQRLDSAGRPGRSPGPGTGDADVAATLRSPGAGAAVPAAVRERIEPRLGASLESVQVHTGPRAEAAASALNARAFTYGSDVFLNRGESPHDLGLMAHEATHVVQQGATARVSRLAGEDEEIQRLPDFITDRIAEYARHIPGYTLFTVLIGYNPITGRDVPRTAANLVQGLLELVPFGALVYDKLQELGVIEPAVAFIDEQLARYDLSLARVERLIDQAWDRMDFIRLDPFEYNVGVLIDTFTPLYDDVVAFAGSVVEAFVALIREAAAGLADDLLSGNPAWELVKKILHWDPIRGERVEAETVEILADFLLLIGRETELEQMREKGTLQETADWIDTQLAAFQGLLESLTAILSAAWEAIQPRNLANLLTNLEALAVRVGDLIADVWRFATTVAAKVLELVKAALLGLLSDFVHYVPGFHLVTVLVGRNPFTGETVPRTPENVIRGFISLLPGGIVAYERLAETGVVGQAAAAIEAAIGELGISWAMVRGLFLGVWEGLSIDDLVDPVGAFTRIRDRFGEPIARLFSFIGVVVREVFRLVLALMHFPTELLESVLAHAMQAMEDILTDPVGFLLNMLAAVKEGFARFLTNILEHMLEGLLDWLFRGLRDAGIEPPADLSLESALDLVMQVLGLTVDQLWEKLTERLGPERVEQIRAGVDRLTGIWEFVKDVQERGVAAIWGYISDQLGDLWSLVVTQAAEWIMTNIVQTVTAKLLSLLDPTGVMAVVNSFIAVFNAIESAIEYLRDMLEILNLYVSTMASIARGDIEAGAGMLEQGLAAAIPVALGFLANQVGLGRIGDKIAEIVGGLREVVDRALDWLLDMAERALEGILGALGYSADQPVAAAAPAETGDAAHDVAVAAGLADIDTTEQARADGGRVSRSDAEQVVTEVRSRHPVFTRLEVVDGGDSWDYLWAASDGSRHDTRPTKAEVQTGTGFACRDVTDPQVAADLVAAGYRSPYRREGRWVIARVDARGGLPPLSVSEEGLIVEGSAAEDRTRGEVAVELGAILSSVGPHPYRWNFRVDPTAGMLRLGSSLRREVLAAYRPRATAAMRREILSQVGAADETAEMVEVPVGLGPELEEVERTGRLPRSSGVGLRATAMSDMLIDDFMAAYDNGAGAGWPPGWEVHHVVPTDWGGLDNVSNYAAIHGAEHAEITAWWNRLRALVLRDAEAGSAHREGSTGELRSVRFE